MVPYPPPQPRSSVDLHFQQKMMIRSMTFEQYQYKQVATNSMNCLFCYNTH